MSDYKPIQHSNNWFDSLYLWLIGRAEAIYGLEPLPRPISGDLEKTFYDRVNEGKRKLQSDKYEL